MQFTHQEQKQMELHFKKKMAILGPVLSLVFIIIVARLLLKKYHPHAVLLIAGLAMLLISLFLKNDLPPLKNPSMVLLSYL